MIIQLEAMCQDTTQILPCEQTSFRSLFPIFLGGSKGPLLAGYLDLEYT